MGDAPILLGRDAEVVRLRSAIESAHGGLRVVLLEGEAGIGKSLLLAHAKRLAEDAGFLAVAARAEEIRNDRPFSLIADFLAGVPGSSSDDPLIAELTGGARTGLAEPRMSTHPDTSLAPIAGLRFRLIDAVVERISELAELGPVAMLLDDLQWADDASAAALSHICQRLAARPLALIGACRPVPGNSIMVSLARGGRAEFVPVRPLDEEGTRALAATLVGADVTELAPLLARAGGNPFYVRELLTALVADGSVRVDDGHAVLGDWSLPPAVQVLIALRLGYLPAQTVEALRWAAVLGTSFSAADLATVTDSSIGEVIGRLQPALAGHVITGAGRTLAFRHDLVREAVYTDLPEAMRAAFHLHVGRALLASGADPVAVAPHLVRGAEGVDPEAARWLQVAADQVVLRSPAAAVGLLEHAIELTSRVDPLRRQLRLALVKAMLWSGRWDESLAVARDALEGDDVEGVSLALRFVIARALAYQGRLHDSVEETRAALVRATSPVDRARLEADLSLRLPLLGDLRAGRESAARALGLVAQTTDPFASSSARSGLSVVESLAGHPATAVESARLALPLDTSDNVEAVQFAQPYFFEAIALIDADLTAEAEAELLRLRRRTDQMGMRWATGLADALLTHLHGVTGEWLAAETEGRASLDHADESGTRVWSLAVLAALGRIALHRGHLDVARGWERRAQAISDEAGPYQLWAERCQIMRALLVEATGDPDRAWEVLRGSWTRSTQFGWASEQREVGPHLARLARMRGELKVLASVADLAAKAAGTADTPSYVAAALVAHGFATGRVGAFSDAADAYASVNRRWDAAAATEQAGLAALAAGDESSAERMLQSAAEAFGTVGAARDEARLGQVLRGMGVRRGPRAAHRRDRMGWSALTRSERLVADLAAQGFTNREIADQLFVSTRTVGSHLAHVFQKLEIRSRVELAAAAARRDASH